MLNAENQEFKKFKGILLEYLSNKISKPIILVVDNLNIRKRLEDVFKYDIQELAKYNEYDLFTIKSRDLRVFKICDSVEYQNLNKTIKDNSDRIL